MITSYDIVVIGGGPAGSAAAGLLASAGFNVCVIEKKTFPRDVLCGEFLSAEVINFIKRQNLFERFLSLKPERINEFRFINDNGKELATVLNFEAYALKRSVFDNLLIQNAEAKGAAIIFDTEVKSILRDAGKFILSIKTPDEEIELKSSAVIAAYGKQNILDKQMNRPSGRSTSGITGIKFHLDKIYFTEPPLNQILIFASDNIYCGVNPINADEYTICFLDNLKDTGINPKERIYSLIQKNQKFRDLFTEDAATQFSSVRIHGTGNLYFGKKEKYKDGVYFIGDAAGLTAPLAGDGISMAVESARLIADYFIRRGTGKHEPEEYIRDWDKLFLNRLKIARRVQSIILNGYLRSPGVYIAAGFPGILNYLVNNTRSN